MKTLRNGLDVDQYFSRLEKADNRVLFLDYDGTLAPFVEERECAVPYPGIVERLGALIDSDAMRTVIVSGRSTGDLLPLLPLDTIPEIWGCHGWERLLPGGETITFPLDERAKEGLERAHSWIEERGHGHRTERKAASVALHWRGDEPAVVDKHHRQAAEALGAIAAMAGLELRDFDGGVELRAPGRNKGSAVKTVLGEFADSVMSAYLGDDETDEDAFRALSDGGLSVVVRKELRSTGADLWIEPPGELLDFLDRWILVCQ